MQISRLFEIVYLLLDKKTMTASELAEHFEVSTRTIYRDIDTLAQSGIPVYGSKGSGGGIRLTENFVLNKSFLSEEEQKSILSSLHGMNALQVSDVRPVLEKLSALFGTEHDDQWIEIDFSSWNPNNRISLQFDALKKAVLSRKAVTLRYHGFNGKTSLRTVEPMMLVFRGYDWYLLAWCRKREDYRYFKLTRIDCLSVLEEHFERRSLPEQKQEKEKAGYNAPITAVSMRVTQDMAYRVYDEFAPEQRTMQDNGAFIVRFSMPENDWLYQYLMTFGPTAEVLEPENIRSEFIKRIRKILKQYEI